MSEKGQGSGVLWQVHGSGLVLSQASQPSKNVGKKRQPAPGQHVAGDLSDKPFLNGCFESHFKLTNTAIGRVEEIIKVHLRPKKEPRTGEKTFLDFSGWLG